MRCRLVPQPLSIDRRLFLRSATQCVALSLLPRFLEPRSTQTSQIPESLVTTLRDQLLAMINEERSLAGASPVFIDDLANRVAAAHALDMAQKNFANHWGSDGLKPYQRYSFAGGTHATEENISSANNTWSMKPADLKQDIAYLHVRLYSEMPPSDGHRKTILAPYNTHVGFGIAAQGLRLRVVELFVAKHVEIAELKRQAKAGTKLDFSGRVITPEHKLVQIEVLYEPLPSPPELSWLRTIRPYSLPEDGITLRLRLPKPLKYVDGSSGVIESDGRNFHTKITLFRSDPAIYTVICWIRKGSEKPFIATEACIKAD